MSIRKCLKYSKGMGFPKLRVLAESCLSWIRRTGSFTDGKKGASQLRSTCVLRNCMKVIKTMDGAFLLLSKILGTKGIHSSLSLWTTNKIWMAKNGTMICPMSCKKLGCFSWKVWAQDPYMSKRQSGGDKHLGNTKARTQSFTMTQSANLSGACLKRGRIIYSNCKMEKKRKIANRTDWKTWAGNLHFSNLLT